MPRLRSRVRASLPAPKYRNWTKKESKDSLVRLKRVPPGTRSKKNDVKSLVTSKEIFLDISIPREYSERVFRESILRQKEFIRQQHKGGFLTRESAKENIKSLHQINLAAMVNGLMQQAKFNLGEGNISLGLHYYQLALSEISKSRQSGKILFEEKPFISEEVKRIPAKQKAEIDSARISKPQDNVALENKVQSK